MNISVKGDYALKAIFDLAYRGPNRPVKIVLNYDEVLAAYRQRNAMNASIEAWSATTWDT